MINRKAAKIGNEHKPIKKQIKRVSTKTQQMDSCHSISMGNSEYWFNSNSFTRETKLPSHNTISTFKDANTTKKTVSTTSK
jgi:hypothetical protein